MLRALAILLLPLLNYCDAVPGSACKVSKAYDGTCKLRSQCKTLKGLSTIQYRSQDEQTSPPTGLCGDREVCCPPRELRSLVSPEPPTEPTGYEYRPVISSVNKSDESISKETEYKYIINTRVYDSPIPDICGIQTGLYRLDSLKIVGGNKSGIAEFPWLALLEYEPNEFMCGGSLISHRHVLTAAHCFRRSLPKQVILSEYNITTSPVDMVTWLTYKINITNFNISVEWAITHPEYRPLIDPYKNDIALIKLSNNVNFTDFIRPICLPLKDYNIDFTNRTKFTVAGWGSDNVRQMTDVMKSVSLPYVSADDCQSPLPDNQYICAGGKDGEDSCKGDSGGPLMYRDRKWRRKFVIVGVVSSGFRYCGTEGYPGFYTSVYKHLSWIHDMMKK
ncbi:phenoloxidase-activating enzyme-like isoform X1 [Epargyreus clarus]|uniref:phenoloxidase-activating enzyme-like isoform X1 n=1 Tax=Epargyreus clarus TaxID=520877 RepID=UPI003C2C781C